MMVNYDTITGDYSPSYFDAEFTRCTHFRHMIERGSKIADFIHMLIAIGMPRTGTVFNISVEGLAKPLYI